MTAGIGKMSFVKFILSDGIACLLSNSVLFWLAYLFGKNYQVLLEHLKIVNLVIFVLFTVAVIVLIWYKQSKRAISNTKL
jgi:membrane protein DedA with SNARE-associated domain